MEAESKKIKLTITITKRSIYSLLGLIGLSVFNFFQFKYWIIPNLKKLLEKYFALSYAEFFEIFWSELVCYISIALSIILFFSIFKKLKKYSEGGLINKLIRGLFIGLICGLIGLITGSTLGLIVGLVFGLILGFVFGLIFGLEEEFKS